MTVRAPIDSHGASKWMIERLLAEYRRAYRFRRILAGLFSPSGADGAGGIGEKASQ